jgi:FkbM family methyltransferase
VPAAPISQPITVTPLNSHLEGDRLQLIDVGARGGLDPRWERFQSNLELTAFEPDPAECELLNQDAACLPYPARFLPHAIWREASDEVPFHVVNWPVASSIFAPNEEFLRPFPEAHRLFGLKEVRTIATVTLDEALGGAGLGVDHLKIDVEGAELDVMSGAEKALTEALTLEVEVEFNPIFRDQPLFADVDQHLRSRGWAILGLRRNSWRRGSGRGRAADGNGGQLVSADALYWNLGLIEAGLSLARELKLLVILAAYLQSDLIRERLGRPGPLGALAPDEIESLEGFLVPRAGLARRLAQSVLRRFDAERRRAIADLAQRPEESVWHDPHYF